MLHSVLLLLLVTWVGALSAAPLEVAGMRIWYSPERTRMVLDTSGPAQHKIFPLNNPPRLVVDIPNARLEATPPRVNPADPLLKGLRTAPRNRHDLRVVLDLKRPVHVKSFTLRPNQQYGNRLVLDLEPTTGAKGQPARPVQQASQHHRGRRDLVIAIDAGHGGEDPGARGRSGTREKDVVLAIARRLEALVRKEKGMRPVMIRKGDYYIGLRERTRRARKAGADLFISIHADAFRDRKVRGASVYALSTRGASGEAARWLAKRENAADLRGGVSLEDKDDLLASVLLDLSQSATIESSLDAAERVLRGLGKIGKLHKHHAQQAGFVVLKSPDIPSILVETAFISNPREERRLRSRRHQNRIARAVLDGIKGFFRRKAPPGTWYARRNHVIAWGDTLSEIAHRYDVSLTHLKTANGLKGDRVRVGQVLTIPAQI